MKRRLPVIATFLFLLTGVISIDAQGQSKKEIREKNKAEEVKKLLDSRRFVFKAQSAQSFRGGNINLTSSYDLTLKKDTLISYLPYFGRAYSAPYNPTESPLSFNSTNFSYNTQKKKKGGQDITIEFKDQALNVRKFYLTVSDQGYATLQTLSTNRDPISFTGYIAAVN